MYLVRGFSLAIYEGAYFRFSRFHNRLTCLLNVGFLCSFFRDVSKYSFVTYATSCSGAVSGGPW